MPRFPWGHYVEANTPKDRDLPSALRLRLEEGLGITPSGDVDPTDPFMVDRRRRQFYRIPLKIAGWRGLFLWECGRILKMEFWL